MPTLRQRLTRPHAWLVILALVVCLAAVDAARPPAAQVTARAYIGCVRVYQRVGRPVIARYVRCRYVPSCSEYSIGAVGAHGLVRGVRLSLHRIRSCTREVPPGTLDPVPGAGR